MAGNEMDYPPVEDYGTTPQRTQGGWRRRIKIRPILSFIFALGAVGLLIYLSPSPRTAGVRARFNPTEVESIPPVPPPTLSPMWMIDVHGGGHPEFFASLCKSLVWLERTDTNSLDKRATAVASVQRLYAVFKFPFQSRMDMCSSPHSALFPNKTAWSFYDSHETMTVLLAVMTRTELEPKDISDDLTAAGMRATFLTSLKSQLQSWRINSGGKPESYVNEIMRWQSFWNFTAADLGLNEEEVAAVRKQAADDAQEVGLSPANRP